MDEICRTMKGEKPVLVTYSSTNELDMKQAIRLIIESHQEGENKAYEELREAL